ncbi:MAG: histidinol-phosphate transaminase [Clostridiales bacterium]|nr:histidinol-phosphate transaminase [Clostridiales bacterium]
MSRYWNERTRAILPYTPGEQPRDQKYIKINTNENPYPPSPRALEAMRGAIGEGLRLYPRPECEALREAVAREEGLPGIDHVYMGNGSDELLAWAFEAFFEPGRQVWFADITYSFYPVYCGLFGLDYREIPLREDFRLEPADYAGSPGGVVLANPNAPTGLMLDNANIEAVLAANPDVVVLVDEAYAAFSGQTAAGLIDKYPNLIIARTLSKSHALAGLRVGYCLGQPPLVEAIRRVKNSYNSYTLDAVAQAGALAAIEDAAYARAQCTRVIATRERIRDALLMRGFECTDSRANFLFVRYPGVPGAWISDALRRRGVLVRHFGKNPRTADWLRVSIGSDADMDRFLEAVDGALREYGIGGL